MGVALYKADFLYPRPQPQPTRPPFDPDQQDTPPQSILSQGGNFFYPQNYEDYSELWGMMPKDSLLLKAPKPPASSHELHRKVVFLPAKQQGPVLLYLPNNQTHPSTISVSSSSTPKMPSLTQPNIKKVHIRFNQDEKGIEQLSEQCQQRLDKAKKLTSKKQFEQALEILHFTTEDKALSSFEKGQLAQAIAGIQAEAGQQGQAAEWYEKSANMYEEGQAVHAAQALAKAASLRVSMKQLTEASRCLELALELRQQLLQQDDPVLGETLGALGDIEINTGNFERGCELYGAALHVYKQAYGYDHSNIAYCYWRISVGLWGLGHLKMWIDYHYECLRMLSRIQATVESLYTEVMYDFREKAQSMLREGIENDVLIKAVGIMSVMLRGQQRMEWMKLVQKYKVHSLRID